jgi:2-polyprenyl-6-methoxyphenol hydroxylase-like FAD-dependent oxidoreductase
MVEQRPSVVIVGGGIGGLFAANALIAQGLRVSVYEQAPALGEVGAGVFLTRRTGTGSRPARRAGRLRLALFPA